MIRHIYIGVLLYRLRTIYKSIIIEATEYHNLTPIITVIFTDKHRLNPFEVRENREGKNLVLTLTHEYSDLPYRYVIQLTV